MPILKKFYPKSKKEHFKEISFYKDCRGEKSLFMANKSY
jgi:hypothetical protein